MRRVLVVDDQAHARAAVLVVLRGHGFQVTGLEDGASGLRALEAQPFDLVIVDIYMPGMDGVQFIKAVRRVLPDLPIIAVSGVMMRGSQRTALDFFPDLPALNRVTCLQKPFRAPELVNAVNEALAVAA